MKYFMCDTETSGLKIPEPAVKAAAKLKREEAYRARRTSLTNALEDARWRSKLSSEFFEMSDAVAGLERLLVERAEVIGSLFRIRAKVGWDASELERRVIETVIKYDNAIAARRKDYADRSRAYAVIRSELETQALDGFPDMLNAWTPESWKSLEEFME